MDIIICIVAFGVCLMLPIGSIMNYIKYRRFKSKLQVGTSLVRTWKKDEFTPVKEDTYVVTAVGKKQVKLMSSEGYTCVKDISLMTSNCKDSKWRIQ